MTQEWTIDQLADLVAEALGVASYDRQPSGRVRAVPDKRTIRYYTTLGLLDGPARMQGRTAYYTRRHVLQLVALKRLQARGLSLVEVQQCLAGADNKALARWAAVPADFWSRAADRLAPGGQKTSVDAVLARPVPLRDRFWAAAPATAEAVSPDAEPLPVGSMPQAAVHWTLADGVKLLIEGIGPEQLDAHSLAKLRPAVENLIDVLNDLGLVSRAQSSPDPSHPQEPLEEE